MKNFSKNKLLREQIIENEFRRINNLNNLKPDYNNVVLNAAAIQQQILIDLGMIKKKKISSVNVKERNIKDFLPKLVENKGVLNKENERNLFEEKKNFVNSLSLAEKLGLKKIEKKIKTKDEWDKIEKISEKRHNHKTKCPICLENLSLRTTLILSCSHVFHKVITPFNNFKDLFK